MIRWKQYYIVEFSGLSCIIILRLNLKFNVIYNSHNVCVEGELIMKIMKKSIAFLLAVCLLTGNLPLNYLPLTGKGSSGKTEGFFDIKANAADEDIYNYVASGGMTMITGTKVNLTGSIALPSLLGGYPVVYIGAYAFENCTGITSISFPNTVTTINQYAFHGCSALQSVALSDNLRVIDSCAFRDCTSLLNFNMPNTVTALGTSAFWGCAMLGSVTLSNQLKTIQTNTFYQCSNLSGVVIPPSVTKIGNFAFGSTALKTIIIPSSVTEIQYSAFSGCDKLESVELPAGLTEISENLFENCTKLSSVTIPQGVTAIGEAAFRNCRAMTDLILNIGLLTIGISAFWGCELLQFIEIPGTVTLINDSAFSSCYDLVSVTIPQTSVTFGTNSFNAGNLTIYCNPGAVAQYAASHSIPYEYIAAVTISFDANGGAGSKTVTQNCGTRFPAEPAVSKTGYTCYGWLPVLPTITPNVNTTYTAQWRPNLYTITFDANGGTGGWTRQKAYGDALIAPAVAKDQYLFNGWLPSVPATVPAQNTTYTAQWRPIYTYTVSNGKAVITGCDTAVSGKLNIPPELGGYPVDTLGYRAFEDCSGLTGVTIPDSVAFIDKYAFSGCKGLMGIIIPDSVAAIGDFAFQDCTDLSEIIIPEALTDIGRGVFYNTAWFNAKPNGNVYLGEIYYVYKGLMPANTKITVSPGTIGIADSAFSGRSGIVKVTLPESLIYIGASAFYGCTGLPEIVIPESVHGIGKQAFENCTAMDYRCYPESYGHEYAGVNDIPHTLVAKITFDANGGTGGITAVLACDTALTAPVITKLNCIFRDWSPKLPETVPYVNSTTYTAQWDAAYTYTISGGEATITGISPAYAGVLTIPKGLEGCPVTAIGERAGMDCVLLTGIILPDSIVIIEGEAFRGCTGLLDATLCENLRIIGNGAFYGCTALATVTLPASAEEFGEEIFGGCSNLTVFCYPKTTGFEYADKNELNYILIIKVTFQLNGGTGTVPVAQTGYTGTTAVLPGQADIVRQGYHFLGWAESASATVPLSSYTMATENKTLYVVWSKIPTLSALPGSTAIIGLQAGLIVGLVPGITQAVFENSYISISGNGRLEYTLPESGSFGTGTQVRLIDNVTGETLNTYTIVIFGDVNGDGNITGLDTGILVNVENFAVTWDSVADAALIKAADVNGDGNINGIDAGILVDVENYTRTIDQTTGLA